MNADAMENTYRADIEQIVCELFRSMLGTEVSLNPTASTPTQYPLTALVELSGSWKGTLLIACSHQQAICFANRFLQCDDLADVNEDVLSSLGELANIVGGNLKTAIGSGVRLGTPSVLQHVPDQPVGSALVDHLAFDTDAGSFSVQLMKAPTPSLVA